MRIGEVESVRLAYRYTAEEQFSWPGGTFYGWTPVFVRVIAENGEYGIGEIGDGLAAPELVPHVVDHLSSTLVGEDIHQVRRLVWRLHRRTQSWGRSGIAASVIAGIEIALFDLLGKELGVPVSTLLGGAVRTRIPVYASAGLTQNLKELSRELERCVDQGFKAVKIRLHFDGFNEDLSRVEAAKDVLGDDVRLIVDLSGSYVAERPNMVNVLRMAKKLEPYEIFWIEEPLHPEDVLGHRLLREETSIPIAAGETDHGGYELRALIREHAVDILQPDVVISGGLLAQIRVSNLAAEEGISIAPHTWGCGPSLMANLSAFACLSNGLIAEFPFAKNPLLAATLREEARLDDGYLLLPDTPGLGVNITPEVEEQFPYDESAKVVQSVN